MNKIKFSLGIIIFVTAFTLSSHNIAQADTVYLSNGKSVKGKVTKKNGKVIVVTSKGKRLVFEKSDILYIAKDNNSKTDSESKDKPSTTENKSDNDSESKSDKPDSKTTETNNSGSGSEKLQTRVTSKDGTLTPEHEVFRFLRKRNAAIKAGKTGANYKTSIDNFRVKAHDKEIRFKGKWINQKTISKIFKRFGELKSDANAALSGKVRPRKKIKGKKRRKRYKEIAKNNRKKECIKYLKKAAVLVPDQTMRKFYLGLCALRGEKYTTASGFFSSCIKQSPLNQAYHQALVKAYFNDKKYAKAFLALNEFAKKFPNSSQPFELIKDCLSKMPGKERKKTYTKVSKALAKQFYKKFSKIRRNSRSRLTSWSFPDKNLSDSRKVSIPTPSSYYYQSCSALAVPVTSKKLLLDRGALLGTCRVYVEIGSGIYAEAKFSKVKSSSKEKVPNLATITVPGYSFTPVERSKSKNIPIDTNLTGYTVNWLSSLGTKKRKFTSKVGSVDEDGNIILKKGIAAGETAAPIFTKSGEFAGFIPGYTNCMQDDYSARLFNTKDLKKFFRGSSAALKNQIKPDDVSGKVFKIIIIRAFKVGK